MESNGDFRDYQREAFALRDIALPLPDGDDGFSRLLLIGTTGAGKTTLVRQLIGTDPETERFPSTSTAKTTVADTELIVDPNAETFGATVTFVPRHEVRAALEDCFAHAARAIAENRREAEVLRRILEHPEQRFRFRYILGNPSAEFDSAAEASPIDLSASRAKVIAASVALQEFVEDVRAEVADDLGESDDDPREIAEELEGEISRLVLTDTDLQGHVDELLTEIELRFDLLTQGNLKRDDDDWPLSWSWETPNRQAFLETINHFSSNYAPRFGLLLTPIVNGVRVAGPFRPEWSDEVAPFILIDVEGLGHTPDSISSVSPRLIDWFERVDRIILVDNGQQPMQAGAVAAVRAILTSGHLEKLQLVFTHLDLVVGDNLVTSDDRENHVLGSAENVVVALGKELGTRDEQRLRARVEEAVLLAGIHQRLNSENDASTAAGLRQLLKFADPDEAPEASGATSGTPVFEQERFEAVARDAAATFRRQWRGRLGLEAASESPKEHWARIKALTRRLAELGSDEYSNLRPVADLASEIREAYYRVLRNPAAWDGRTPTGAARDAVLDSLANDLTTEINRISRRRLWIDHMSDWREAYSKSGRGSTYVRAHILSSDIYQPAAPSERERNGLIEELTEAVCALEADGALLLR